MKGALWAHSRTAAKVRAASIAVSNNTGLNIWLALEKIGLLLMSKIEGEAVTAAFGKLWLAK